MRLKYIIYPLAIIALIVMLNGCEKFTSGINTSSTDALDASSVQLLSGAQLGYMQVFEGGLARITAILTQQATGTERQYAAYEVYTLTSQDFINEWATAYVNCFADLKIGEKKAAASSQKNLLGAMQVLEGMEMGTMAALWGDVPYSQAGQAPGIIQPAYDAQMAVFDSVQAVLSRGIANLATYDQTLKGDIFSTSVYSTPTSPGAGSPYWSRLGYSAKARYYMHAARHGHPGYTGADVQNVITNGLLGIIATDGSQDISFVHGTDQSLNQNLWYSFANNDRTGYMDASSTFAEPMLYYRNVDGKSNDTARLQYYYDKSLHYEDLNYGSGAFGVDHSYPAFSASETLLLLAEAYYYQGNTASALTYLNSARTYANTVFGSSLSAYVAGDFSTPAKLLQAILNEEYLALAFQIESFNLARRVNYQFTYTDSASVVHTIAPTTGTVFPQRFPYSQDELTANPNVPKPIPTVFQTTYVNQ